MRMLEPLPSKARHKVLTIGSQVIPETACSIPCVLRPVGQSFPRQSRRLVAQCMGFLDRQKATQQVSLPNAVIRTELFLHKKP